VRLRQIPSERFPHGGLPVAEVAVEPPDLIERSGVVFEEGLDGPGPYDRARPCG
jgi:hypothetical protein